MMFTQRIVDLIDYDFCQPYKIIGYDKCGCSVDTDESKKKAVLKIVIATIEANDIITSFVEKSDERITSPYVITMANAAMCSASHIVDGELTAYIDEEYQSQYIEAIKNIGTQILQNCYNTIIEKIDA